MAATSFDRESLAAAAGVNPWDLLARLRRGDPAQIEALAAAFYEAAGHLAQARDSAERSRNYVEAGYPAQETSPVDFTAEAAGTTARLAGGAQHLPAIAEILSGVAADLDAATRRSAAEVSALDCAISGFEQQWSTFFEGVGHHLPEDDWAPVRQSCVDKAVAAVKSHGGTVHGLVGDYEASLHGSLRSMAGLGYVPPSSTAWAPSTRRSPGRVAVTPGSPRWQVNCPLS